jgi:hypothetical protein
MPARRYLIHLIPACLLGACSAKDTQSPNNPETPESSDHLYQHEDDGGRVGNGGEIVRCFDGKSTPSMQLKDFYEASKEIPGWSLKDDFKPNSGKPILEQAVDTAVHIIDKRWRPLDSVLADFFTEKLRLFPNEVAFRLTPLKRLSDGDGRIGLEEGCQYLQIANQLDGNALLPWEKRYLIQKDLFYSPQLSNHDRAGLIIHEIVYAMSLLGGAVDSRFARVITALLFSDQFKEFTSTPIEYFKFLKIAKFPFAGAHGVALRIDDNLKFFNKLVIEGSALVGSRAKTVTGDNQDVACRIRFNLQGVATDFSSTTGGQLTSGPIHAANSYYEFIGTIDSNKYGSLNNFEDSFRSIVCNSRSPEDYDVQSNWDGAIIFKRIAPMRELRLENNSLMFQAWYNEGVTLRDGQFFASQLSDSAPNKLIFKFNTNAEPCKASAIDSDLNEQLTLVLQDTCAIQKAGVFNLKIKLVEFSKDAKDFLYLYTNYDLNQFVKVGLNASHQTDVLVDPGRGVGIDHNGFIRFVCVWTDTTLPLASTHENFKIDAGRCVRLTEFGEIEEDSLNTTSTYYDVGRLISPPYLQIYPSSPAY